MICSSLCRVPFIAVLLSWVGENSHSSWSSFRGLGQEEENARRNLGKNIVPRPEYNIIKLTGTTIRRLA
jgi:hypothetical protein